MKVLSLFSGIGAFEKALTNMGVNYELVNYCEIDKYASKSYSAIHKVPESKNLGDITKVDTSKLPSDIDLLTYGFPCQDISLAGKMKGFEHEGERTRSGLFFEALRLIEDLQPKFAICENVKNLTTKKFAKEFDIVLSSLEEAGYKNYWQVLNAKDYGVPQNRERVFIISIREDIDKGYEFPEPFPLELRLKDMLDEAVDEKYYITDYERFVTVNENKIELRGGKWDKNNDTNKRVYSDNYISPTIPTCGGGNTEPKVFTKIKPVLVGGIGEKKSNGGTQFFQQDRVYDSSSIAMCHPASIPKGSYNYLVSEPPVAVAMRGRYNENGEIEQNVEVSNREYANAITTVQKDSLVKDSLRIRKLTPKECFRIMGFDDEDFLVAEKVNSNSQLYKQAGNSIVVDVIEELYEQLFKIYWSEIK